MRRFRPRRQEGFTTIELLVAMLVLGIILIALLSSFVTTLSTAQSTGQSVVNYSDAQLLSYYLPTDVASADSVRTGAACGASSPVLELEWQDGLTKKYVVYTAPEDPAAEADLHVPAGAKVYALNRTYCESAAGPPLYSTRIARYVQAAPTVTCDGATCSPTSGAPFNVAMSVTEFTKPYKATGTYTFAVSGTRRVTCPGC